MSELPDLEGGPYLPYELRQHIIDQVFSFIGQDWRNTREACAVVSKAFCHLSRQHRWRNIKITQTLDAMKDSERLRVLAGVLGPTATNLGGIAPHVKSFTFYSRIHPFVNTPLINMINTPLCLVLDLLHCSEDYGILRWKFTYDGLVWAKLKTTIQQSLYALAHSPHLRVLELEGLAYFPLDFIANPNLVELRITKCGQIFNGCDAHAFEDGINPIEPLFFESLEALVSDCSFPFQRIIPVQQQQQQQSTKKPFGLGRFTNLKTLTLSPSFWQKNVPSDNQPDRIIQQRSDSVEELTLDITGQFLDLP